MIQVVAAICMLEFGVVLSSVGANKLSLAKALGIDNAQVAGLISALMLTNIVSVLAIGPLVDVWGHRPIAVSGLLLTFVGFPLFVAARSYFRALAACVTLGIGGTCGLVVSTTLFPLVFFGGTNAAAAINFGNVFFGVGAMTTAGIAAVSAGKIFARRTGRLFLTMLLAVAVVAACFAEYPMVRTNFQFSGAVAVLARSSLPVGALAFALNTGVVNSLGAWLSSYGAETGCRASSANLILVLFWLAITMSRFVASFLVTLENGATAIGFLALLSALLLVLMIFVRNRPLVIILTLLSGSTVGPITPTITGMIFAGIDSSLYGSAFAMLSAIGFVGAIVIPGSLGLYARRRSVQRGFVFPMIAALLVALLSANL